GVDQFTVHGDQPPRVYDCGPIKIGMMICYDISFPEHARALALEGADLVVVPTNWPLAARCNAEYLVNARAIENQVYCLAVNRVGDERGFTFFGGSRLAHPNGDCLDRVLN